jgi:hypothetical protein
VTDDNVWSDAWGEQGPDQAATGSQTGDELWLVHDVPEA